MLAVPFLGQNQLILRILRNERITAMEWAASLGAGLLLAGWCVDRGAAVPSRAARGERLNMLTHVLFFLLGLGALVLGAEALVRGASKIALSLGISPLVVGLTIVAMGTSSPEVAVSVGAALSGNTDIAVGNVVGSNIFTCCSSSASVP